MAPVWHLSSLLVFLAVVHHHSTTPHAWPVAPGGPSPAIKPTTTRDDGGGFLVPTTTQSSLVAGSPVVSATTPSRAAIIKPASAIHDTQPQSPPTDSSSPSQSSGANQTAAKETPKHDTRPAQISNHLKPSSIDYAPNSGGTNTNLNHAINRQMSNGPKSSPSPSRPAFNSERHVDNPPTDRLTEGSGMGPLGSRDKNPKIKLDDTDESGDDGDDDDEDYDETIESGSGQGSLNNNKPLVGPPKPYLVESSQNSNGELKDRPQESFYKPFRPPPPSSPPPSPSPTATQQSISTSGLVAPSPHSSSSTPNMPMGPSRTDLVDRAHTTSPSTTPPPRFSPTISTLQTPGAKNEFSLNRTKSEADYEDDEDEGNGDEEEGDETSAFEDNDPSGEGSEVPASRQPSVSRANSTQQYVQRPPPLDWFNQTGNKSMTARPSGVYSSFQQPPSGNVSSFPNPYNGLAPPIVMARPASPTVATTPLPTSVAPPRPPASDHSTTGGGEDTTDEDEEDEESDEEDDEGEEADKEDTEVDSEAPPPQASNRRPGPAQPVGSSANTPVVSQDKNQNGKQQQQGGSPMRQHQADATTKPTMTVQNSNNPQKVEVPHYQTSQYRDSAFTTTPSPILGAGDVGRRPVESPPVSPPVQPMFAMVPSDKPDAPPTSVQPSTPRPESTTVPSAPNMPPDRSAPLAGAGLESSRRAPAAFVPTATTIVPREQITSLDNQPQLQQQQQQLPPVFTVRPPERPRGQFTSLEPTVHQRPPPPIAPTNNVQYDRALRDSSSSDDETLTKQMYDKAVEVYREADKTVRAAWEAVWPPNVNFDTTAIEPLLSQPLFFMFALGLAIICLVLLMMLVVYIISCQIHSKEHEEDDISIY